MAKLIQAIDKPITVLGHDVYYDARDGCIHWNGQTFVRLAADPVAGVRVNDPPTEIKPRPLAYSLADYHNAPGGVGPLAYDWEDKPHRLLYDLIAALAAARSSVRVDDPALALLRRWIGDRSGRDESERMAIEDALYEDTEALLAAVSSPAEPETGGHGAHFSS